VALTILFWLSSALLVWVYVLYPLVVAVVGVIRPVRFTHNQRLPTLSVVIAVHNEAAEIAERIADVFAQERSGARLLEIVVGSDGSTDGTDEIVSRLGRQEPRLRLLSLPRSGTTPTQHALVEAAKGEIVVLTDAETRFAPGCLAALAEVFGDERVGCATGRLEWQNVDATATSRNEGLYWRYERRVRELESRAGFLTAVTGAVLALRRADYRPVHATTGMDHLLPLYVRELGHLVVYVPGAQAADRPISGLREQFRNRTRTATRGIQANLSMAGRLAPWRHPRTALAIWSHKLLRWATPWLVALAVFSASALAATGQPGYAIVPLLALAGVAAAAAAHLISGTGRRPPRLLGLARALAVVNLAFAIAWLNVLRRRRIETWHRAEWTVR
jgi:cellulose synthase/poly-beta-1,6-N-acetylglucosamine synthase-like glycosyltransferase